MNFLILGGAGFLGSNLARNLLKEKPKVKITVFDFLDPRLGSTIEPIEDLLHKIKFIQGDIRDKYLIDEIVCNQDVIYNCAAQTSHPLSLKDPFFDVDINCIGNLRILEAVKNHNKNALLVYISSSTVIGKAVGDVIEESHWERPLDIYSANKGVAEKYYRIYHKVYGLKTTIIRFANLYGPYGKESSDFGFVNYFISEAWKGNNITIYKPGNQTRNVMYVEDATDLLIKIIDQPKMIGDLFFAAHDQHLTIKEIAYQIEKTFKKGKVKEVEWPEIRKKIEIENVIITSAKLKNIINWQPKYSFEDGLVKTKEILTKINQGRKRK